MIVVIPSCRRINLQNLQPLIDHGARFIVVDDSEGSVHVDHPQFEVHDWSDRRRRLGDDDIAIPKRNGACRDYGFYIAWHESDPGEIIIALDDDCALESAGFPLRVEAALSDDPRPVVRGAGRFFNFFEGAVDDIEAIYARCTVAVRMTRHDGLTGSIQEPLLLGRHAIWTYPFPGVRQAEDYPALRLHIEQLLELHESGRLDLNLEGRHHIQEHLHPETLAQDVRRRLTSLLEKHHTEAIT